ncbi:hypothetical protein MED297_13202 [Reinekea sp. MED297]|uniref:Uncharacterized protein n=1 Tax=Reinekea blandensis MED297 TaxID=314283 RepID=A4BCB6_9GAMM|nr:hypothetical protein MED297_13202 [Reinekea sp. MED297] [Reinekea blandensis MED297]
MSNAFVKKCTDCGAFGASFQITDADGNKIHLCNDCNQKRKAKDKPEK